RDPKPPGIAVTPATVVERRKSPRGIIDPRPSPRLHPCPLPIAVWGPSHGYIIRIPDVAVFLGLAPLTIVIEILIAGNVIRKVITRRISILTPVAVECPAVKVVAVGEPISIVVESAAETHALTFGKPVGISISVGKTFTLPHVDHGHSAVGI